jgi:transposase
MTDKYIVDLTTEEREQAHDIIKKGKHSARKVTRAHILLLAADDLPDDAISEALHTSLSTVHRIRQRFVEGGLINALNEQPRPGAARKLTGKQEAFLGALACSAAPAGRTCWTMQLLADRMIELKQVDSLSDETVRVTLKKTIPSRGKSRSGASRR